MALLLCGHFVLTASGAAPPMGRVVWWGENVVHQSSNRGETNGVLERDGEILTNIVAIAAGNLQILALTGDGIVLSFGANLSGGNEVPVGLSNVVSIAVEGSSCWAIKRDGTVARWGNSEEDPANLVGTLTNVTSVAFAGYRNYLALKTDGTVLGFRLEGNGSSNHPAVLPVEVGGQVLSNVAGLLAGDFTPQVLKTDGTVLTLGYQTPGAPPAKEYGEVEGNSIIRHLGGESGYVPYWFTTADPWTVNGEIQSNVAAIAAGNLALKRDGTVVAMSQGSARAVLTGPGEVIAVAAGIALKRDGTVAAWGDNESGQASVPAGLSNVVAIAADGQCDVALTIGPQPPSVYIPPHGRLEEMAADADLVFKGQVVATTSISNSDYQVSKMEPHITTLKVISVLKGNVNADTVSFAHYAHPPIMWGGPGPPFSHSFAIGESDCVFLANADSPYAERLSGTSGFEQGRVNGAAPKYILSYSMQTLDSRPFTAATIRQAHWNELNLLLNDTNPTNVLYAVQTLDWLSSAGDFKRSAVLGVLLPLITNRNEQLADRAISCFEKQDDAAPERASFRQALLTVANNSPSVTSRFVAVKALSAKDSGTVSNAMLRLLTDPDEYIRLRAVNLLPRFSPEFAEEALRERADDESTCVQSVVADVIGYGKYVHLLPTLKKLFEDSAGKTPLIKPLQDDFIQMGLYGNAAGDVRASAGYALTRFDTADVSNILKANLNDPTFHVQFIAKLAEKDAGPWLAELTNIIAKTRTYSGCWEDLRNYLMQEPKARITSGDFDQYINLLEWAHQTPESVSDGPAHSLYEFYRTMGLEERATRIRQQVPRDKWWFDDFDEHHPELNAAAN